MLWYRVHWGDCPQFNADNAWSCLWGPERSDDGSQCECTGCGGTGESYLDGGDPDDDDFGRCRECDGTGWMDCEPGYSCVADPADLIEYFARRVDPAGETVIVFTGRQASSCVEGHPTVVPDKVVETMTWEQFTARYGAAA